MRVTVYTTPACVQCQSTKRMMDKIGISYDVIDLSQHPEELEAFKEMGLTQAPIVVTDDARWSGFRLDKIKSLANRIFGEHGKEER